MTSTGRIDSVPNATAPIACAPPTETTSRTPATDAAANTTSGTAPSGPGGTHNTISSTPATDAGTAVISTVDG